MSKLTESERKRLDGLQRELNDSILAYGRQQYIVKQLEDQLTEEREVAEELREEVTELENKYDAFVKDLYQKYGDVAIDLDTGDIIED